MKSTIHRTTRPLLFGAALLLALGGCAQEGFESSDLQQTRHSLQTTLERDVRPAVTRTHPEPLEVREATRRFYRGRGYAPAWADENGLVAGVEELMTALEEARGRGLAAHSTTELSAMIEDGTIPERSINDPAAHRAILQELDDVAAGNGKAVATR